MLTRCDIAVFGLWDLQELFIHDNKLCFKSELYNIYFFPIYYKHSDTLGAQSMEPATLRVLSHMIALPRLEHVSAKAIIVCHSEPGAALPPLLTLLATVTT